MQGTDLVADVGVTIAEQEQYVETDRKQEAAQQVSERSQVRDRKVVRVGAARPQAMHHPHCDVEQDDHLKADERQQIL